MNIRALGSIAKTLLNQPQTARVWGNSRRGIFLKLESGWVVFLSNEVHHGPLTLNLDHGSGLIMPSGTRVEINPDSIHFPRANQLLNMEHAIVWGAPPRSAHLLTARQRKENVLEVIRQAQAVKPSTSLAALQAILDGSGLVPNGEAGRLYPYLSRIANQLPDRFNPSDLIALLGMGSGLTPSGDDILLGLLLALNRWGDSLALNLDRQTINQAMVTQAYRRTTTLSANLIECASQGQADERLVAALDGLITGEPGAEQATAMLADWGNSSGLDALCGMAYLVILDS